MKLKELSVGQKFRFKNKPDQVWEKISDNGDIAEYNYCRYISEKSKTRGLMLPGSGSEYRMDKEADVVIINSFEKAEAGGENI